MSREIMIVILPLFIFPLLQLNINLNFLILFIIESTPKSRNYDFKACPPPPIPLKPACRLPVGRQGRQGGRAYKSATCKKSQGGFQPAGWQVGGNDF